MPQHFCFRIEHASLARLDIEVLDDNVIGGHTPLGYASLSVSELHTQVISFMPAAFRGPCPLLVLGDAPGHSTRRARVLLDVKNR